MRRSRSVVPVFVLIFALTAGFVFYTMSCYFYHQREVIEIPKIKIALSDITLDEMIAGSKDTKYEAVATILDEEIEDTLIEFKGRGNSTWGLEKSPYQIKFDDKVDLFGLGKAKKWVLLANYLDPSNLRTEAAFFVERMLGEQFALDGRFVELIVDGDNVGLYYLTPKMEIDKNRVDLKDPLGILMEYDNLHAKTEKCVNSVLDSCMVVKDVVSDDLEEEATEQFMDSFNELQIAIRDNDYETVKKLADVRSFAIYYLISEFSANPDGYASSLYFYKDGTDDLIHAGPGWDFDYAFGNKDWRPELEDNFYSPYTEEAQRIHAFGGSYTDKETGEKIVIQPYTTISKMFYWLIDIPEFKTEVRRVYRERMLGKKDELIKDITDKASYISEVAFKNNEWYGLENFYDARDYLLDWLSKRFDFFDILFDKSYFAF